MHVVESLANTLTSALNAHLGTANTDSQYLQGGQSAVGGSKGKHNSSQRDNDVERLETRVENSTLPSGETLTDPGISLADTSLTLVRALKLLISPKTDGKPDWETIRGSVRVLQRLPQGISSRCHLERKEWRLVRRIQSGSIERPPGRHKAHF